MGRIQEALERAESSRDERRRLPRQLVRLQHRSGSLEGREQRFKNDSILIGRAPHNDVAMDPFEDSTVSAQHAEIRTEGTEIVLYDMGSLNGTFVNGFPVRRAIIVDGDVITLGRSGPEIVVQIEEGAVDPASGPGLHGVRTPVTPISFPREEIPDTAKTPIQSEESSQVPQIFLIVILIGIVLDIVINLVRGF